MTIREASVWRAGMSWRKRFSASGSMVGFPIPLVTSNGTLDALQIRQFSQDGILSMQWFVASAFRHQIKLNNGRGKYLLRKF